MCNPFSSQFCPPTQRPLLRIGSALIWCVRRPGRLQGISELLVMDAIARPTRQTLRMRGRSYVAFVFSPAVPIVGWLEEIDAKLEQSPGFFVGKPVVLDLSAVDLSESAISHLIASLEHRDIRVLGIEGVEPERLSV